MLEVLYKCKPNVSSNAYADLLNENVKLHCQVEPWPVNMGLRSGEVCLQVFY
jgi:hypothetical protein